MRTRTLAATLAAAALIVVFTGGPAAADIYCPAASGSAQYCHGTETVGGVTFGPAVVGPAGGGAARVSAVHPKPQRPAPPVDAAPWEGDVAPSLAGALLGGLLIFSKRSRQKLREVQSLTLD